MGLGGGSYFCIPVGSWSCVCSRVLTTSIGKEVTVATTPAVPPAAASRKNFRPPVGESWEQVKEGEARMRE